MSSNVRPPSSARISLVNSPQESLGPHRAIWRDDPRCWGYGHGHGCLQGKLGSSADGSELMAQHKPDSLSGIVRRLLFQLVGPV